MPAGTWLPLWLHRHETFPGASHRPPAVPQPCPLGFLPALGLRTEADPSMTQGKQVTKYISVPVGVVMLRGADGSKDLFGLFLTLNLG